MNIEAEKIKARKILSQKRKIAKAKYDEAHNCIVKQFLAHDYFHKLKWNGKYVAGYLPIASEIDVLPLLADLRKRGAYILLPAIIAEAKPLEFRLWNETDKLVKESFGTQAPSAENAVHVPDVILSPLLGFDAECYRLGYGGGFYDRSLQAVRAVKPTIAIGLAYDEQMLDNIPKDRHDMRLNGIVTPTQFYLGERF